MRTIKLKTTESSYGFATPQHPAAPLGFGRNESCFTYAITEIPANVPDAQVVKLFNATCIVSGCSLAYSQLGVGVITKGGAR